MDKKPKRNPSINMPEEVDNYLADLPEDIREALEKVRRTVKEIVPNATERVSYQVPILRLNKDIVGFAVQKNHCSFYTMSRSIVEQMKEELENYKISGTTIHFSPQKPLSRELIEKIVRQRLIEIGV
ncbi:iron chaperone [Pseudobacteroides cellulosolvens]|uniref:YdhG-like domain-containing protein n=1 Tax=Pseudobacteroides cellulosolvens ATCC 35603 = DSM 2933 TaxID=398512 RepID=A0A0L6JP91_9FIRM|nr:DUF1801 domain-containing protein [Pseudobacteroides cellulosolvens]KNY27525.1 protein of unknown function DUF1801 [Pseudobacteroides cellulosolvens ATCC 35603 = DSM 2933]